MRLLIVLGLFGIVATAYAKHYHHRGLGVSHTTNNNEHVRALLRTSTGGRRAVDPPTNETVKTLWFEQKLDHFNDADTSTWQQKFSSNSQYFKPGTGALFLMLGGEGPAEVKWMTSGAWIELYAPRFNAMAYQLEHRYYGDSHPVDDLSMQNLRYLSSEQALADAANFIVNRTAELNLELGTPSARWIVFGGSYSGALAAWLRYKYPHLVFAAVSSSGPVEARLDFSNYMDNVLYAMQNIQNGQGAKCIDAVAQATAQVNLLLTNGTDGRQELTTKFQLCDATLSTNASRDDESNFVESLASNFQGVVQYNRDNRRGPLYNLTIDDLCDIMTSNDTNRRGGGALLSPLERYAKVNAVLLARQEQECLDISYEEMIANYTDVSWNATDAEGGRQWTYQTCTEFGYYQTSDSDAVAKVFGNRFPLEFFTKQCQQIFTGIKSATEIQNAVKWSNVNYGGKNLEASRVIFINGKIDPWHLLGVTTQTNMDAPAVFVHDTAHCADMYSPAPSDSIFLQNARKAIVKYLAGWLSKK